MGTWVYNSGPLRFIDLDGLTELTGLGINSKGTVEAGMIGFDSGLSWLFMAGGRGQKQRGNPAKVGVPLF